MINYDIIFSGVEFGIPQATGLLATFVVCVQHTTGYPKDFLSLRRSNFVFGGCCQEI